MELFTAATTGLTNAITWVGTVVDALIGTDGALAALLPMFAIGIGISALLLGVKIVRNITWGA